ncbi:MAG: TetR-like C-terminal domain-containing protein, partial [Chthoniobacterales bacterium]
VFIPRRQAFTGLAFQAAKDRGEIPADTDVKLLMDLLYGYSLFRLITRQIDDDEVPDRVSAAIAKLARSDLPAVVRTKKRAGTRRASGRYGDTAKGRIGETPNAERQTLTANPFTFNRS